MLSTKRILKNQSRLDKIFTKTKNNNRKKCKFKKYINVLLFDKFD